MTPNTDGLASAFRSISANEALRSLCFLLIFVGSILLIVRLAVIRKRMGAGIGRTLVGILVELSFILPVLVLLVLLASAIRFYDIWPLQGEHGRQAAGWIITIGLLVGIWIKLIRVERWYNSNQQQATVELQQLYLAAEARALRGSIDRLMERMGREEASGDAG